MTFYPNCTPYSPMWLPALVNSSLASCSNITQLPSSHLNIWLRLDLDDLGTLAVRDVYCQWSSIEEEDLHLICSHAAWIAFSQKRCVLIRDFNLDTARITDSNYSRMKLANSRLEEMSAAGYKFIGTSTPTNFFSWSLPGLRGWKRPASHSCQSCHIVLDWFLCQRLLRTLPQWTTDQ